MKIKSIISEYRNDFNAVMECEHCGHQSTLTTGHHDNYYHTSVIPAMTCKACGKNRSGEAGADKTDEDGWIAYLDTHPLPVDGWTIVDIKLRDGTVRMKQIAGQLSWPWGKTGRDIIAYRIHKEK